MADVLPSPRLEERRGSQLNPGTGTAGQDLGYDRVDPKQREISPTEARGDSLLPLTDHLLQLVPTDQTHQMSLVMVARNWDPLQPNNTHRRENLGKDTRSGESL